MNNQTKILVVALVAAAVVIIIAVGQFRQEPENEPAAVQAENLPRLLELGSVGCQACAKMEPVIEELRREYEGRLSVEFYDVRQNPAPAEKYGIKLIPTQIFLDAEGNEFYRHQGYFPKEEIVAVLERMGVTR